MNTPTAALTADGALADEPPARIMAVYHVACPAARIKARAEAIAIEQSVETPLEAIDDRLVIENIAGRVEEVSELGEGLFEVRIALAAATTGFEAGQLFNMLFGNTSIHTDVVLRDAVLPDALVSAFGGPRHGLAGLRARADAPGRALTCSALKPQGLSARALADLAGRLARGGLDFVKDDHGLADQLYCPFKERVPRVAAAVREARHGTPAGYVPALSGDLDTMRRQLDIVRGEGLGAVLIAPMVAGVATFHTLVREYADVAFMAHPALAGAARIAPPLLLGKLFRLLGADATVFPNHGGRFGYSPATCRELATSALAPWCGLRATVPVAAGGMTLERVEEVLRFYGRDVMLLLGGALVGGGTQVSEKTAAFVGAVERHGRGR